MPKLHIYKSEKETSGQFAEWFCQQVVEGLKSKDKFTVAVSAGDIPVSVFKVLLNDFADKIDWAKVHLFSGDEKCANTPNVKMYGSTMKPDHSLEDLSLPIPKDQIYTIRKDILPDEASKQFEAILQSYFPDPQLTFDLVILGIGENGKTLSLLPNHDENSEKTAWVIPVYDDGEDVYKVTMTSSVINAALTKAFIITGKKKQDAVQQILNGKYDPTRYPAQLIQTVNKSVHWFLDEMAAGKLIRPTL